MASPCIKWRIRCAQAHFSHWGLTPQNSNPHNFGPEVDIDFVPTAFIIVPRVLKCDVVKFHQMAPPHIFAPPPSR